MNDIQPWLLTHIRSCFSTQKKKHHKPSIIKNTQQLIYEVVYYGDKSFVMINQIAQAFNFPYNPEMLSCQVTTVFPETTRLVAERPFFT